MCNLYGPRAITVPQMTVMISLCVNVARARNGLNSLISVFLFSYLVFKLQDATKKNWNLFKLSQFFDRYRFPLAFLMYTSTAMRFELSVAPARVSMLVESKENCTKKSTHVKYDDLSAADFDDVALLSAVESNIGIVCPYIRGGRCNNVLYNSSCPSV